MATTLPFPLVLPTALTAAGAAPVAVVPAAAEVVAGGAIGGFDFATLMAAQIDASNPPATTIPEAKPATPNEAVAETPVIIITGAPVPLPSEESLIQAAGGADTSTTSAEQAVAAAIDSGIAPVPSERLVLATTRPAVVQTAASVHALDRLLDKLSGPVPAGLTHMVKQLDTTSDSNGVRATERAPTNQPTDSNTPPPGSTVQHLGEAVAARVTQVHDALRLAVDNALQARDRAALIDRSSVLDTPSSIVRSMSDWSGRADTLGTATMARGPLAADAPWAQPTTVYQGADLLTVDNTDRSPHAALRAHAAQDLPTNASTSPMLSNVARASDLFNSGEPADTSGTPQHRGEPAALSNGKSSTTAIEVLQQRFASLGVEADIWMAIERVTADARLTVAPPEPTKAALPLGLHVSAALPNAVGGTLGTQGGPNSLSASGVQAPSSGLAGAMIADTNGSSTNGAGSDTGGFENPGAAFGSSDAADFFTENSFDGSSGFSSFLANQSSATGATRALSSAQPAHPPLPPVPPDQIAVHIAEAARNGARNISIQLRPAALGRIEVELSVGRDGTVRSRVLAERSETLELLQRDARGLERALEAAGLRAETGGLSFGLKDGGQHGYKMFDQTSPPSVVQETGGDAQISAPSPAAYNVAWSGSRALDIKV